MTKIPKVSQSIFGQGRSARITTRPVAMPNPYEGAASAVEAATDGINRIFNGAMKLAHEGQQLALEDAQVAFNDAVTKRLDAEVFSLSGEAAAGSVDRASQILREEESRQLEHLSKYGAGASRNFRTFVAKSSTDRLSSAMRYGQSQVKRARIDAGNKQMAQSAEIFATTGSTESMNSALSTFDNLMITQNGRIVTSKTVDEFDENLKNGFVAFRGEKLKIVDAIKPGDRGVITRDRAATIRASLDAERQAYEKARQIQIDSLAAMRVDKFLEWGQLDQAQLFLESFQSQTGGPRVSEGALSLINSRLEVFGRTKVAADSAGVYLQEVIAAGAKDLQSAGGRYLTPDMEQKAAQIEADLAKKASEDLTGVAKQTYNQFQMIWNARKKSLETNFKTDYNKTVDAMNSKGLFNKGSLSYRHTFITNLPDGPVKAKLAAACSKEMAVEKMNRIKNLKKSDGFKANHEALMTSLKVCIAAKQPIQLEDGTTIDTTQGIDDLCKALAASPLGLTGEDVVELRAYATSPRMTAYTEAGAIAATVLDSLCDYKYDPAEGDLYFNAENVWFVMPGLKGEVERITRFRPDIDFNKMNDTDRKWLGDRIRAWIIAQEYTDPVSNKVFKLQEMLKGTVRKDGTRVEGKAISPELLANLGKTSAQLKMEHEFYKGMLSAVTGEDTEGPTNMKYDVIKKAEQEGAIPVETPNGEVVYIKGDEKTTAKIKEKVAARKKQKADIKQAQHNFLIRWLSRPLMSGVQDPLLDPISWQEQKGGDK